MIARSCLLLVGLAALSACNSARPAGTSLARFATATPAYKWSCPKDLSFIRDDLVTPAKDWPTALGPGVMEKTLSRPVDDMIVGGYRESVESGRRTVRNYQKQLENEESVRAEYKGYGKTDEWIDTHLLTVRDGVTINQAFLDAVECRRENGLLEASAEEAPPATSETGPTEAPPSEDEPSEEVEESPDAEPTVLSDVF